MGSLDEQAATKSTWPAPASSSTTAAAFLRTCSSIWATWRGVNAELISRRYRVCCGGSIIRKKVAMRCSSAGIGSSAMPWAELNSSGCRLAWTMSARRVSAQNPGSVLSNTEGTGGCQLSPSADRSSAKVWSRASNV